MLPTLPPFHQPDWLRASWPLPYTDKTEVGWGGGIVTKGPGLVRAGGRAKGSRMAEGTREDGKDLKGHCQGGRMPPARPHRHSLRWMVHSLSASPSGQPTMGGGWGTREVVRYREEGAGLSFSLRTHRWRTPVFQVSGGGGRRPA